MTDESTTLESEKVSMEDLLAAFVADPSEESEARLTDIKGRLLHNSWPAGRRYRQDRQKNFEEVNTISCLDEADRGAPSEQESLPPTVDDSTNGDMNDLLLEEFFDPDSVSEVTDKQEISHKRISSIELTVSTVTREAHLLEIDRLKCVILEAQETIIRLLTDRVEDKAKIASLEAQLKYLPLQHLGDANALQLRHEQEQLRNHVLEIKHELQKQDVDKMRNLMHLEKSKQDSLAARFAKFFRCQN
jgi:hypothetical protein